MPSYRKCLKPAALLSAAALLSLCFAQQRPTYKDPAAPMEKRVADLISRMTLEEKISQLMNDSAAIDRLDVPAYNWWNECLHGVARAGRATVFPEAIGLAATWDTDQLFRVSTAIRRLTRTPRRPRRRDISNFSLTLRRTRPAFGVLPSDIV